MEASIVAHHDNKHDQGLFDLTSHCPSSYRGAKRGGVVVGWCIQFALEQETCTGQVASRILVFN